MTKSKQFGKRKRQQGALDRLLAKEELIKKDKDSKTPKRIVKEIEILQNKL